MYDTHDIRAVLAISSEAMLTLPTDAAHRACAAERNTSGTVIMRICATRKIRFCIWREK